ncbi:MAG: DUF2835 domain-containing protein [endosymbiont of Galathealinum brachiosum]|uniref:DUF2835 domain-containing protein n=1 Tax=endosymbiont of Galathealinum brachiosum TaxID=2200906 RepID=A0A370DKC4_9GAMM|nr:MAG: DUF2835 domain-containing protein [endosymbiont of Galathealinum brachiosum]
MQKMRFSLSISSEKYQAYYAGHAKFVRVHAEDGRSLKFPAVNLKQFVMHDGIHGRFEVVFNDQSKLVSLRRI